MFKLAGGHRRDRCKAAITANTNRFGNQGQQRAAQRIHHATPTITWRFPRIIPAQPTRATIWGATPVPGANNRVWVSCPAWAKPVSIGPGKSVVTLIPSGLTPYHKALLSEAKYALVAKQVACSGPGKNAAADTTFKIHPCPRATIPGKNNFNNAVGTVAFTCTIARSRAADRVTNALPPPNPALLIK